MRQLQHITAMIKTCDEDAATLLGRAALLICDEDKLDFDNDIAFTKTSHNDTCSDIVRQQSS